MTGHRPFIQSRSLHCINTPQLRIYVRIERINYTLPGTVRMMLSASRDDDDLSKNITHK